MVALLGRACVPTLHLKSGRGRKPCADSTEWPSGVDQLLYMDRVFQKHVARTWDPRLQEHLRENDIRFRLP